MHENKIFFVFFVFLKEKINLKVLRFFQILIFFKRCFGKHMVF